jgi:hypothetical protein
MRAADRVDQRRGRHPRMPTVPRIISRDEFSERYIRPNKLGFVSACASRRLPRRLRGSCHVSKGARLRIPVLHSS